jgi:ferredoxin-nitrite reductase
MRLKYVGLFHRRKATYGRFMMRVRLPNGIITAAAMKYMGELCATYGDDGCSDITTRQNMQLRGILLEDVPEIFKRLAEFNITTTQVSNLRTPQTSDSSPTIDPVTAQRNIERESELNPT